MRRGSRENEKRVQGVRRVSVESQESLKESLRGVQRQSREGPERVREGSRESQERVS